jgi:hypothetical protein
MPDTDKAKPEAAAPKSPRASNEILESLGQAIARQEAAAKAFEAADAAITKATEDKKKADTNVRRLKKELDASMRVRPRRSSTGSAKTERSAA